MFFFQQQFTYFLIEDNPLIFCVRMAVPRPPENVRGNELANDRAPLDNQERKRVWGVSFAWGADIPRDTVEELVQEAILADETRPYTTQRGRP